MKYAHLREPPGLLFVIAHHDTKKAHDALMQYLISKNKHPQIVKLQATELQEQAISYVAGETLEALTELCTFISAKKFAWTCPLRDNDVAELYVCIV